MLRKKVAVLTVCGFVFFVVFLYTPRPPTDRVLVRLHFEKKNHNLLQVTDEKLQNIRRSIDIDDFKTILKPILVERVVGTTSHEEVKNYIVDEFNKLKWNVELDTFYDVTPKGKLPFTNIIVTHNTDSLRYLVFACHYDSKLSDFVFIGATDSAVPCAMLIYLAKSLNDALPKVKSRISLKFIFFDGEEAFVTWTAKDSLYGSRHLSEVMESRSYSIDSYNTINDLHKIDLFVLLDLLGAPSPTFYSYFNDSHRWYKSLVTIEKRLKSRRLLEADSEFGYHRSYFVDQLYSDANVQDDHTPFLDKDVSVLHIIPLPFPDVWHTENDNESAINFRTVKNLLIIFKAFIIQYLDGTTAEARQ